MRKQGRLLLITFSCLALLSFSMIPKQHPTQSGDNTLSAAEKKAGWKMLFDGKSTDGWRPYKNKPSDGWEVVNGEIHCKEQGVQHRADLITKEKYGDFELSLDWKVGKAANSGIIYLANEEHDASYESGPEYQLIDDNGYPDKLEDWQKSGSYYAMYPPARLVSKPAGEYNHTVIKVKGKHVEHWLNGVKVVDFESGTPEWFALKEKSKWKDIKDWGQAKEGYICLQDHGGGVWFRNIKIRKL